jgi:hypothetical protein
MEARRTRWALRLFLFQYLEKLEMCIARLLLISSVAVIPAVGAVQILEAAEVIMLRAGENTGSNVVFAFEKDSRPQKIAVRTMLAGVAGSRIDLTIDKAKTSAFSHVFTAEECKFGDGGSACEVFIPSSSIAYKMIVAQFKRGSTAHVTVVDAGVMKMDQTVSLKGFTKSFRG